MFRSIASTLILLGLLVGLISVQVSASNHPVQVSFGSAAYRVAEGGTVTVSVTLSAEPGRSVTIPIQKTVEEQLQDADYSGIPPSVTFGNNDTSKSFTVRAAQDNVLDDGGTITLGFGALPSGVSLQSVNDGGKRATVISIDPFADRGLDARPAPTNPPKANYPVVRIQPQTRGIGCSQHRIVPGVLSLNENESACYRIRIDASWGWRPTRDISITPYVENQYREYVTFDPPSILISKNETRWWNYRQIKVTASENPYGSSLSFQVRHNVSDPNFRIGTDIIWDTEFTPAALEQLDGERPWLGGCHVTKVEAESCEHLLDSNSFAHKGREYIVQVIARHEFTGNGFAIVLDKAIGSKGTDLDDLILTVDGLGSSPISKPVYGLEMVQNNLGDTAIGYDYIRVEAPDWQIGSPIHIKLESRPGWVTNKRANPDMWVRIFNRD